MRALILVPVFLMALPAAADYRITRDHGGLVEEYKAKYAKIRDRRERVIIDGVCNAACTLVLGIVPSNRVCATPRASLGFRQAYRETQRVLGIEMPSIGGAPDLLSLYPPAVKDWIKRRGGLTTTETKRVTNGPDLWALVEPCPEEF